MQELFLRMGHGSKLPIELIPLCHYFYKNYVGCIARKGIFECGFWTMNDRLKLRIPRTSNYFEGWQNRFSKKIKYSKLSALEIFDWDPRRTE
jgi:hypothetical protein